MDGFIVVGPSGNAWRRTAEKPVVVIGSSSPQQLNCHGVVRNNEVDGRLATQHLIDGGRRNIVALVTRSPTLVEEQRISGYAQSMAKHDLVPRVRFSAEGLGLSAYSESVEAMAVAAAPFDAIVAIDESTAFPALRSLRRLRLQVPEDVAVVGFESSLAALATDPPLTTIEEPSGELARRAVDAMHRLISGETPPRECDRVPGRLIERSTSVPINSDR
ncbi:MAG TPA: LacI family DNA-binding transcriptional regulator [Pedococcus sp.]|nr:LacI family DNA-binding transcriptional regulator [Pedococcus sp.]